MIPGASWVRAGSDGRSWPMPHVVPRRRMRGNRVGEAIWERPAGPLPGRLHAIGEPVDHPLIVVGLVFVWTTVEHQVRATGVAHELGLDTLPREGDKQLLPLADRAPVVLLAVH